MAALEADHQEAILVEVDQVADTIQATVELEPVLHLEDSVAALEDLLEDLLHIASIPNHTGIILLLDEGIHTTDNLADKYVAGVDGSSVDDELAQMKAKLGI